MKRIVRLGGPKCWKRAYAVFVLCVATAIALPAQTFTTLHVFDGTDGYFTRAPLVQATNGNFYGTTVDGGVNYGKASSNCSTPPNGEGCGTVFEISPNGTLTTLHSFCADIKPCKDGFFPYGLVQATDGNFYGTTQNGGTNGRGTVFKITPSGTLTTLHSFCAQTNCADGAQPFAGLVQGTDGDFYGTTGTGGTSYGTAFKITPGGTLTTLYSFCSQPNCTDGAAPTALVQAANGDFYGTTGGGGGRRLLRFALWLWDSLQNDPERNADDAVRLPRASRPLGAGPGH